MYFVATKLSTMVYLRARQTCRSLVALKGTSLATPPSVSAATLAYSTLPCPKATPRAIQILERDIILSHILSIHGLCSISPWFRCHHLFAKLDHMHLMRDHLGDVLFFAVLALP